MRPLGALLLLAALVSAGCLGPSADDLTQEPLDTTAEGNSTEAQEDQGPPGNTTHPMPGEGTQAAPTEAAPAPAEPEPPSSTPAPAYEPHVIVGIPDTGINPYHEVYHRPERTEHPCTYVEGFPCDLPALELSIGEHGSWEAAFEADRQLWEAIEPGDAFWIPRTNIVAAICQEPYLPEDEPLAGTGADLCILDDSHRHGTGTTSSVLSENPDALIAFKEGDHSIQPFSEHAIPVDVYSVSWGHLVNPTWSGETAPVYLTSSGNDPGTTVADAWAGRLDVISVGGFHAEYDMEETMAAKQPDIVSQYCREGAATQSLTGTADDYCGTSFSTPTAAGALSKVILGLRRASGYTGSVENGSVDPVLDISIAELRAAMNRTATYDPEPRYEADGTMVNIPLNPVAPWVQMSWGFYDGTVADDTLAHLLGIREVPEKPEEARLYMETVVQAKQAHPYT